MSVDKIDMTSNPEKVKGADSSSSKSPSIHYETDLELHGWDEKRTKALLRKIDITLIPFLALLYL